MIKCNLGLWEIRGPTEAAEREAWRYFWQYYDDDEYPPNTPDHRPKVPSCPRCGNNRQVWANQITGKMTCHRAGCHTELEPPSPAKDTP